MPGNPVPSTAVAIMAIGWKDLGSEHGAAGSPLRAKIGFAARQIHQARYCADLEGDDRRGRSLWLEQSDRGTKRRRITATSDIGIAARPAIGVTATRLTSPRSADLGRAAGYVASSQGYRRVVVQGQRRVEVDGVSDVNKTLRGGGWGSPKCAAPTNLIYSRPPRGCSSEVADAFAATWC